jgi:hypothetical protein
MKIIIKVEKRLVVSRIKEEVEQKESGLPLRDPCDD